MKDQSEQGGGAGSRIEAGSGTVDSRRRGALRRLLAGGAMAGAVATGLPSTWTRPVVQSVVLPVHAQTSEPGVEPDGNFAFPEQTPGLLPGLLNRLVPSAHAIVEDCDVTAGCAVLKDSVVTVHVVLADCCCYNGSGEIGDTISLESTNGCILICDVPTIEVADVDGSPGSRVLSLRINDGGTIPCAETGDDCDCDAIRLF